MTASRRQALSMFKQLIRTGEKVFNEDAKAVEATRAKIKLEFAKHKTVNDPAQIQELLNVAKESEEILRTKVIQAKEVRPSVYRIRQDHLMNICVDAKRERCADCTCGA